MDYEALLAERTRTGKHRDPNSVIGRIRAMKPGDVLNVSRLGTRSSNPLSLRAGMSVRLKQGGLDPKEFATRIVDNEIWVIRLKPEDVRS